MKVSKNVMNLLTLAGGLGILGGVLRLLQETFALDGRDLLIRGHVLTFGVLLVLGVTLVILGGAVRKLDGSNRWEHNFQASPLAAVGLLMGAVGILLTVLTGRNLATIWAMLALIAVGLLAVWAGCRYSGKPVPTLCPLGVCLFFLAHLVANYRTWSADPQTMDYLLDLLAAIFLMLFCYYCATFAAGIGSRRMQLATGLMAVALCLMALAHTGWPWLYLGGGCLAATNLCRVSPVPKEVPHADS